MIMFFSVIILLLLAIIIAMVVSGSRNQRKQTETLRDLNSRLRKAEEACLTINHDLNLAVLNEISRIEQNLRQMDYTVKGVSNISNRVLSMKAVYSSLGYEMPELMGTEYNQADNHQVTLQYDGSLEPGKSVVKKVIRPAVLFNNNLIQSASIVVSFNDSPRHENE
ncbi:MAG: hypothetical protein K2O00_02945 [Muribaculaceae bacterium]|nr:hypothetical protein [Muribaculaceae bacterium]